MTGARRRLLIATNQLWQIAGSEVVALETAKHFAAAGWEITTFANWAEAPMAAMFEAATGAPVITDPARIHPFTFDAAYVQHQVLGLFDYAPHADDRPATRIVAGRLSRRSFMESGGWLHDRLLVDHVLANSALTAEHLARIGDGTPITIFYNAAPAAFFAPFRERPVTPGRILVVTNHSDPSLGEAVAILRRSTMVERIGVGGDRIGLITPEMIASADLVVSIGKTVPYAIASRVPVYVYDHFGGPGYLDADNIDLALRYNFSGRSGDRLLSGPEIAADIIEGYSRGVAFARDTPQDWIERFYQPRYLDLLTTPARTDNGEKRRRMAEAPFLAQEALLASYTRDSYIHRQRADIQIWRLKRALREATGSGPDR